MELANFELKEKLTYGVIEFDELALDTAIKKIEEYYSKLVISENDLTKAREDMANLNKAIKVLEDGRKRVKSQFNEPLAEYENKMKSLSSRVNKARDGIKIQVDYFVNEKHEAKTKEIELIIVDLKEKNNVPDLDIAIDTKWLADSCKLDYISNCVENQIFKHKNEIIENQIRENAQSDRLTLIDKIYNQYSTQYGNIVNLAVILADTRLQDLTISADDVEAYIIAHFDKAHATQSEEKPKPRAIVTPPVNATKSVTMKFTYNVANSEKLNALFKQIDTLCINTEII